MNCGSNIYSVLKAFIVPGSFVPVAKKLGFNCIVLCTSSIPVSREEKVKWALGLGDSIYCNVAPLNRREVSSLSKCRLLASRQRHWDSRGRAMGRRVECLSIVFILVAVSFDFRIKTRDF